GSSGAGGLRLGRPRPNRPLRVPAGLRGRRRRRRGGGGRGRKSEVRKSKKKKPWRLRWPDDFRDEVLARFLELNEQRHNEELLIGSSQLSAKKEATGKAESSSKTKAKRRKKGVAEGQRGLEFDDG
ncbi:MAG: hypothetical protein O3C40_23195, partial [Planctomycetota bacterium]|nr:hypothetical protein [Planctomycetota bacterium]